MQLDEATQRQTLCLLDKLSQGFSHALDHQRSRYEQAG
jgi:hypothetical protein